MTHAERHPLLLDRPDLGNYLDCHIVASWGSSCGDVGFPAVCAGGGDHADRSCGAEPIAKTGILVLGDDSGALHLLLKLHRSLSCVGDNRVGIGSADFLTGVDL